MCSNDVDEPGRDKIPHLEESLICKLRFLNSVGDPRDKAEKEVKLELPDVVMRPRWLLSQVLVSLYY